MARRSQMSVQKRLRERKKAEKASLKREERAQRKSEDSDGNAEASREDLEALGLLVDEDEADER